LNIKKKIKFKFFIKKNFSIQFFKIFIKITLKYINVLLRILNITKETSSIRITVDLASQSQSRKDVRLKINDRKRNSV